MQLLYNIMNKEILLNPGNCGGGVNHLCWYHWKNLHKQNLQPIYH